LTQNIAKHDNEARWFQIEKTHVLFSQLVSLLFKKIIF